MWYPKSTSRRSLVHHLFTVVVGLSTACWTWTWFDGNQSSIADETLPRAWSEHKMDPLVTSTDGGRSSNASAGPMRLLTSAAIGGIALRSTSVANTTPVEPTGEDHKTNTLVATATSMAGLCRNQTVKSRSNNMRATRVYVSTVDSKPDPSATTDEQYRQRIVGTWQDQYRGKRTLTIREDGTATMVVEPEGMGATIFSPRLEFNITWSIDNGRINLKTLGGRPAGKVVLILKIFGDNADEEILELTGDRFLVQHDEETQFDWRRVQD